MLDSQLLTGGWHHYRRRRCPKLPPPYDVITGPAKKTNVMLKASQAMSQHTHEEMNLPVKHLRGQSNMHRMLFDQILAPLEIIGPDGINGASVTRHIG